MRRFGRNGSTAIAVGIAWGLAAGQASALPAPLEQHALERQSDLIVEVDVLSVAKTGSRDAPVWRARLRVRKALKGRAPSTVIRYDFVPPTPGLAGELNTSVFAGERLRMYLIFERGEYVAWASNSIEPLIEFPAARRILPRRHGEVIHACRDTSPPQ
jgi:hypothetical protein